MKQKHIPGIGTVNFIKRRRGKYVNISVQPSSPVCVSLPYYVSYQYAEDVLLEKLNWVRSKIEKVKQTESKLTNFFFETDFKTKYHQLVIKTFEEENVKAVIAKGVIEVFIPKEKSISDEGIQDFIRKVIIEAYRIEAKHILPNRVKELALKHGIEFNSVYIKNMKSQWGSCSGRKNINLNLHLMRLPEEFIDYIILHELTHIDEMNHSTRFWKLLESRVPNARLIDKKMKDYSISYW
ncbi:MAG: M48 family metallopeptidase [Ignavibacteriae bacterium]|nr:M48 family peptidase [Ignavibacteriota bacterium]NOG97809.1 M48 family metallopeptidase [Ignavibacteriota bacterium]